MSDAPKEGRKPVDWAAVERDYRTGSLTDRELGRLYGCSHTAVQKHAKAGGWQRDLSAAVRSAARAKLQASPESALDVAKKVVAEGVASQTRQIPGLGNLATGNRAAAPKEPGTGLTSAEQTTVEIAALRQVEIIRSHRASLLMQRRLLTNLMEQLEFCADNREAIEDVILDDTADATGAAAARRRAMLKAVSLGGHVGALKDLSVTLRNVVEMERQAFGIDEGNGASTEETYEDRLKRLYDQGQLERTGPPVDAEVLSETKRAVHGNDEPAGS